MSVTAELDAVLDRLAEFENEASPVVSLYLDLNPGTAAQSFQAFLDEASREHGQIQGELERVRQYLADEKPASQAIAFFCCSGDPTLFEAVPLDAPLDGHRLYIDREPHLFPLERLADQYASYAALLVNTNAARLYVFSAGAAERQITVRNKKGKRVSAGGWSQARYQRRVENLHTKHIKEVADAVEKLVREEGVTRILVAGDEVALPLLRDQLTPPTRDLLTEVSGVDMKTADADVFRVTLEAFREADHQGDEQWVNAVLNAYRARGLATVGVAGVRAALERGQVDRLVVPAIPSEVAADHASDQVEREGAKEERGDLDEKTIEELVTQARRTDAEITFIEDATLLKPARGVGAILRYRI